MLDLTKQGKRVIVFLMATALLGIGIICYKNLRYRPRIEIISDSQELEREIRDSKIVNINTATKEEIVKLRGIGPALAETIIEYRAAYGPFRNKEELKNIKGIGRVKYDEIEKYIKVE